MAMENKIEQHSQPGTLVDKKLNLITNGYKTMEFLLTAESCPPFRVVAFDESERANFNNSNINNNVSSVPSSQSTPWTHQQQSTVGGNAGGSGNSANQETG